MFSRAPLPVSADQVFSIALATDPAWHDAAAEHFVAQIEGGDWSAVPVAQLVEQFEGVEVVEGVPCVGGEPVTKPSVIRVAAAGAALLARRRWIDEGVWPEGFEPGPVARLHVSPLDLTQRATVEATCAGERGARAVVLADRARWRLQVRGIEQGGETFDADQLVAEVTAHSPRQGDALRGEINGHLRRMWAEPVTLGKGFAALSGCASPPHGGAAPRKA